MRDNDNPSKDYHPIEVPKPDPTQYAIFKVGARGGLSFYPRNIIKYLAAKWVIYDGRTPRVFNGRSYQVIPDTELDAMMIGAVDSYGTDQMLSNTELNSITRNAEALLSSVKVLTWFDDPDDMEAYAIAEEPDSVWGLFAFQNGILNTDTQCLLPFTHHLLIRSLYCCRYTPAISTCRAESIIEGILPDPETRRFFYEMVGYILYGPLNPPAIFVIYGPGGTGKSALSNMISALMGEDMISRVSLNQLSDRFMPALLEGKRLNISGETGEGKNRYTVPDGEVIKQLSGGEEITVQRKHGHPYKIRNTAKLLFVTNTIPNFGDTSSGLYRRLYTIPCRVKQDPTKNIYDLMTDPDSLSWLANVSLQAYREFRERGGVFGVSDEMTKEWQNMRVQDPVFDFLYTFFDSTDIHDICAQIINHSEYRKTKNLYDKYREFCYANAMNPLGSRKFYEKLRNETELDIGKNPIVVRIDGIATSTRVFTWKQPSKAAESNKSDSDTTEP